MSLSMHLFKRSIHDWVFAVGGVLLSLSVVPVLWSAFVAPTWAAILAVVTLTAFALNYYSMKLYFSTAMAFIQVVLWSLVLIHSL